MTSLHSRTAPERLAAPAVPRRDCYAAFIGEPSACALAGSLEFVLKGGKP